MIVIDYANLEKLCSNCNKPNTEDHWYKYCNSKLLQQNFPNWTSGNEFIDKFIQETQLNAQIKCQVLEWIPYNRFKNIEYLDKGGFCTIYKAIWNEECYVALKSLNNSSDLSEKFLNEV